MIPGGEPRAQLRVGAAMLGLIVAGIVFVVAILPRIDLGSGIRARVLFDHVGALKEGAPMIVAGRRVGKVESITLSDSGGSVVHVRIDDDLRWMVPVDGDYFIASRGVLSDRYLEVGPPRSGQPPGRAIQAGDEIRGVDPPSLDRALQRTWDNLVKSRVFLEAVAPELAALQASLRQLSVTLAEVEPTPGAYARLAVELAGLYLEAKELGATLDAAGASPAELRGLAARAGAAIDDTRAAVARVRAAADQLVADLDRVRAQAGAAAPAAFERLRAALAQGDALLARTEKLLAGTRELMAIIERGEGSMMKLSRDPEFPEDAKAVGKMLKRSPWRVIGHPDDSMGLPPKAPKRER